jgi:hypothetical protein
LSDHAADAALAATLERELEEELLGRVLFGAADHHPQLPRPCLVRITEHADIELPPTGRAGALGLPACEVR